MSAPFTRVILSPHLDDAALSIGGTIARFTAAGDATLVVTIAAGSPPHPSASPSPFAASLYRAWGLDAAAAFAVRRREDEAAMAILGATARHLALLDAVVRLPDHYDTEAALLGEPVAEDRLAIEIDLAAELAPILAASPRAIVFAPLAVGGHVDHRIAHRAAIALARRGREVAFYEDLPYAARPGAVAARTAEIGRDLDPETFDIEATLDRKIAASLAYTSQIGALFGGGERARSAITAYAREVGIDRPAERVFRLR